MGGAPGRRDDRGAAAVEFALVLPALLLLIFGIIDFGRLLYTKIVLTEAARDGARATAVVNEIAGQAQVDKSTANLDDPTQVRTAIVQCESADPNSDASVTLTYTFKLVTPLAALAGIGGSGGTIELSATSVSPCLG